MKDETTLPLFKKFYEDSKHERYIGLWFLQKPALMVNDLDLINRILIKNYEDFGSHETYFAADDDPIAVNLFTLNGEAHKNLKANLTPMFSRLKLQGMVPNMNKTSLILQEYLMNTARANDVVDVKDVMTRFVTDATYSALFGIDINFIKDPNSVIGKSTLSITDSRLSVMLKVFIALYIPGLAKTLKLPFISKELFNFFNRLFADIIDHRKKNHVSRNDTMQSLIELVNKGQLDDLSEKMESSQMNIMQKFTVEHLTAQGLTFLAGSYLNGAGKIPLILYELARNPHIQEKLRKEIRTVTAQNNGEVTYEAICQMEYLQRVIDETLRKYPSMTVMVRACVNDFQVPDSSLTIEKGTYIVIPTIGLHWDEKYFPNPEKFDPDRFSPEKKNSIPNCAYLPYGKGPRVCIGQKFGPLILGTGIIALLSKFRFEISEEHSPKQLEFDPRSVIVAPKGKMMLRISIAD